MKNFTALESDPEVFEGLAHQLGLIEEASFADIYDLDIGLPDRTFAIVAIFRTTPEYEAWKAQEDGAYNDTPSQSQPFFIKQTINNACGLYAIIHATCNVDGLIRKSCHYQWKPADKTSGQDSFLSKLQASENQATFLEQSDFLERVYEDAARRGATAPPDDPSKDVDYHYVCFVKRKDGVLFELDGDRVGPYRRTQSGPGHSMNSPEVVGALWAFLSRINGVVSLMALTRH